MNIIENYGIIGNMRTAALVSMSGSIDFLCFPAFDSPTVFAAILDDQKGGAFRIEPRIGSPRVKQLYLPDTNILLTRFLSSDGVLEITDFMPVVSAVQANSYANQIVRMVRVVRGEIAIDAVCAPRFDYGRARHEVSQEQNTLCFRPANDDLRSMALHATVSLQMEGVDGVAHFTLSAGQTAWFVFGDMANSEQHNELLNENRMQEAFGETTRFWRDWIAQSKYTGRWREIVHRSALVLKLLTTQDFGSVVAAATFGLPEQLGGRRNWDYRYCWLRDSAFSMYAFMRMGFTQEASHYTAWLRDRVIDGLKQDSAAGPLRVMYRIDGGDDLAEITLDHLEGYGGAKPVRIGNGASTQLQLDIYGEIMDAIYLSNKYITGISNEGWERIKSIINWVAANWDRPDEGIWEMRSGQHHFLHSRLMCWVALDRAIRLSQKRSLVAPLAEWIRTRDTIHDDIYTNFWNDQLHSFVQHKGSDVLDAASLLMPLLRFISPTDPQWRSTMSAIEEHLTEGALVFRYAAPDGLEGTEGSFIACSFWRIECLARQGEVDKARLLFDTMLGYANHLGLYSEEIGTAGELLGNFPQALTHLALISAASYLDRKLSKGREDTWQ